MKHEEISLNTKLALAESLKKVMKKKSFSKITVSELIRDCNINRKTFYYHFENIYDLMKWMFEREAFDIVKQFDLTKEFEEAISFAFDYIDENDYIINCAYDAIGRDGMKHFFIKEFHDAFLSIIEFAEKKSGITLEPDYKSFLKDFYAEGFAGILIHWIKNKKDRNREQMIRYLNLTVKQSLMGILQEGEL